MSKQTLRYNEEVMQDHADHLCAAIRNQCQVRGYCEFRISFMAYTTDVVSAYTLGRSLGLLQNTQKTDDWATTIKCISGMAPIVRHFGWLMPLVKDLMPLWLCQVSFPALARIVELHRETQIWAKETLEIFEDLSIAQAQCEQIREESRGKRSPTIFHEIIASDLPEEDKVPMRLGQEAFTLLVAGGESTSRSLTVATYYILANASIKRKLEEELKTAIPNPFAMPKVKDLEQLPWLTACIREALRIGLIFTTRLPQISPLRPIQYKEWIIPPGTPVSLTHGLTMLDPAIYKEPLVFRPERFIPSNPEYDWNMRFLYVFSRGNRSCYGQK